MKPLLITLLLFALGMFLIYYLLFTPVFNGPASAGLPTPESWRLEQHVRKLCSIQPARNAFNIASLNKAGSYIQEQFTALGLQAEYQKYHADNREYQNVICSMGPEKGPRVIVGAHYDVCGDQPGADDNASGVAGLLELARLFAAQKQDLPCRVDFVAFTLEEPPYFRTEHMGSAVHARSLLEQKAEVKAMVCLEMIGFYTDEPNSQDFPLPALKAVYPNKGNFISVVGRVGENRLVAGIKKHMKAAGKIGVESINAPASVPGIDFSDHQNYWAHNIPAVMITNTAFYRNPNYHEATDTPETLDYTRMAEVVKGLYQAISKL